MTAEEKEDVCLTIENEGFDYTFEDYCDYDEIKDKKFHELRKNYLKAAKELREYIGWDEFQDSME